jgi:hypothetical protein
MSEPAVDQRRSSDNPALLALIQSVHTDVKAFGKRLEDQRHEETLALAEAVADLMIKSFPEGDAAGHRLMHEKQMQALENRAEFWKKMLFEVSKYGLIGVVGWMAIKLWAAFVAGLGK